ncbi:ATP-binding protein [Cytobacillus solani]|uniref:ATP-binding protein n=1 Tax=Cytobacillus solani TaxID=1637975 RepID=UPI0011523723|nr:ATP-binding protein [Cytobacillus solani]
MESNSNEIYFNFSFYALNLLGKQMYTNKWSAISELVANGLDAGAKTVRIYINSIDKKNSTIEIFDDGSGMSYSDLLNKYALIGRNKREAGENLSDKVKGRKGVGKLAGLYLSKKYYIVTKKDGVESSWVLDSTNVKASDIPKLDKIRNEDVAIDNEYIWSNYQHGTLIKLTNVDMTNFAEKKLEGLKSRIADYYLLDDLGAQLEIAYVTKLGESIVYQTVKKEVAFHNFYGFFETTEGLKSYELKKSIPIKTRINEGNLTDLEIAALNAKEREVVILTPDKISEKHKIAGEKEFIGVDGERVTRPYELKGWIGIHATIKKDEADKNDTRFMKNGVYNSNRLKLYIRDKLAIDNFLELLGSTQAFANYIEGEISFDILDDDFLPDISSTNREGLLMEDERVKLLSDIVSPIVGRLIRERLAISNVVKADAETLSQMKLEKERKAKEAERKAKEEERRAKEAETEARIQAEKKSKKLDEENTGLKVENSSLKNQNNMKDILLSESDPKRQKLLVHELTIISNDLIYTVEDLASDFSNSKEWIRILPHLKDLKKYSDKLATIKQQFLRLNNYDIIGKQTIDLKSYVRSYLETIRLSRGEIQINIGSTPYMSKVEIFELGVLLDNLITNAAERNASFIRVEFHDQTSELHFISDTGPIEIKPVDMMFDLGVTSKKNGTGIGMFLVKEICEEFGWNISASSHQNIVDFAIKVEVKPK